ncbi:MAG: eukaryotic-like serine/threonine-protein kinase [Pseudomonadota bacterium]|nr:eukaryotic-like serine/threonine-protein kinase [Pseudomonadota bacterium]MDQ5904567.1 eukaryotic-like serine/threonine-protein kinase [Pseudomonadota bacterium]MDQ5906937.1 eukaryotic-like serine/threonine-protein kinase [Pseudomonadota bacterium]MDQ5915139.1 eukaryotic-like serine/threonine-protein kinase [Pseudomonadota bacterium]MDQ5918652.1 eukaryotic-like serine/threonine-protein kinase [Pseudomonadota bacterium]
MTLAKLGRYEIITTLGRGSMGVVYRAQDPLIERAVAIKTVACAGLSDKDAEEFEQRFFREAKSAGRLNHPNIVTIHDVGHSDELAYIAMEFLSGQSLRSILDSDIPLSCTRIIEIVAAVADGLAFAHAQGVVHRDIKPANIMVQENGIVKITDFGIAQLPGGSLTMAGAVLGSPKYMSPEQVAGQKADGRSDIFSLGTVLYEMLTGQPPFSGDNMHATMYQVVHKDPPAPSSCSPDLPREFDPIVAKAMAKDPADRYQSAAEMAADLRKQADSTAATLPAGSASGSLVSPQQNEPPISTQANPPAPRSPRLLRYGVALALFCLFVGAAFFLLRSSAPPVPTEITAENGSKASSASPAAATKKPIAPAPANSVAAEQKASRDAAPTAKAVSPRNWKEALQADLRACDELSVIKKVVCIEKARWKHCPGHWGTIDDCPSSTGAQKPAS